MICRFQLHVLVKSLTINLGANLAHDMCSAVIPTQYSKIKPISSAVIYVPVDNISWH